MSALTRRPNDARLKGALLLNCVAYNLELSVYFLALSPLCHVNLSCGRVGMGLENYGSALRDCVAVITSNPRASKLITTPVSRCSR
jgi:hypothetical protein